MKSKITVISAAVARTCEKIAGAHLVKVKDPTPK